MKNTMPIDFVITWVDNQDLTWRAKRTEYIGDLSKDRSAEVRYRDWNTLRYWFRGVERFAPWVRYVFFVTDAQKPDWLNLDHPKLKWVKHTDYIPDEYLPTFSSNVIELNLFRIKELSENFVYFNDDVFLIDSVNEKDFFKSDLPCDLPLLGPLLPDGQFASILFNNAYLINRHFCLRQSITKNIHLWMRKQNFSGYFRLLEYGRRPALSNSVNRHIHMSLMKKTYTTLWETEYDILNSTCLNKSRSKDDVSAYCIRDWQLFSGQFVPERPIGKAFSTAILTQNHKPLEFMLKRKGKIICLNDNENENEFELHRHLIIDTFEKILPNRSSFELF